MTQMQNNYFDNTKRLRPYTHSLPANPGTQPPANAVRGEKPEIIEGYWPCIPSDKWEQVQDLRGTIYYIRNADDQIEQKTISEIADSVPAYGYLSIDDVPLTETEKTSKRESEIRARLSQIDLDSIRPLRAIAYGEAVQDDHDKLAALTSEAQALRTQLAELSDQLSE